MPKYFPLIPLTSSFLLLNLRPLYRKDEQFAHCIVNGNIIRTVTKLSLGFFPLGTSLGSKSGIGELLHSVLAKHLRDRR